MGELKRNIKLPNFDAELTVEWWVNCADHLEHVTPDQCAIYLDPQGERLEVGDSLWWQGDKAMWTPRVHPDGRSDVQLPRIGFSGVAHPDEPRCETCGYALAFCRKNGGCTPSGDMSHA